MCLLSAGTTPSQARLKDYMSRSGASGLRLYLKTRASSLPRYVLEQAAQTMASWFPSLPGMALRAVLYKPLLGRGSAWPVIESGSELLRMDSICLGKDVYIDRLCRLHASAAVIRLGEATRVMRGAYLCSYVSESRPGEGIETGERCWIGINSVLASGQGGIFLEDEVLIGPGAILATGNHDFKRLDLTAAERAYTGEPIRVGANAWIGAGSVVLGGVSIGEHAVIAAGAVVTKDVPPRCVAGGVPAKLLSDIPERV